MQKEVTSIFGYQQIPTLTTATNLTVPAVDNHGLVGTPTQALIRCEGQAVRFRDDGIAPTASVGMPLAVGDVLTYDVDLKRVQFIEQIAGAILNVGYYS